MKKDYLLVYRSERNRCDGHCGRADLSMYDKLGSAKI
jgi:hypothetical protein